MRVKFLLCLVVLCLAAVYVSAETIVVTPRQQARVDGLPSTGGVTVQGPVTDSVGWMYGDGVLWEYQQHVEFDLSPYKDRANQLLSATLSWRNQSWLWSVENGDWLGDGNYVEVDQVPSHGTIGASDFMWSGNPTMGKIASGLWSKNDQNDVNDRYEYDVTGQAADALPIASSTQGIHFVWSNNNMEDMCFYNLLNNAAITNAGYSRFWGPDNDIPNPNSVNPTLTLEFNGGSSTVTPVLCNGRYYWGYGTQAAGIGNGSMAFTAPDSHLAAWSVSEAGEDVEWRVSVGFDVQRSSLGLSQDDTIFSAILKFDTAGWVFGRDQVTVDQTGSYLLGEDPWDYMYDNRIASGIYTNGASTGSHSVDITSAFVAAMNNASAESGISFVWYCDNDADPTSPYVGSPDWISYSTGYTVDNAVIEITYASVPPGICGGYGTQYLAGDVNKDCKVDFADVAFMAADWLQCTVPNDTNCSGVWYNQ